MPEATNRYRSRQVNQRTTQQGNTGADTQSHVQPSKPATERTGKATHRPTKQRSKQHGKQHASGRVDTVGVRRRSRPGAMLLPSANASRCRSSARRSCAGRNRQAVGRAESSKTRPRGRRCEPACTALSKGQRKGQSDKPTGHPTPEATSQQRRQQAKQCSKQHGRQHASGRVDTVGVRRRSRPGAMLLPSANASRCRSSARRSCAGRNRQAVGRAESSKTRP